MSAPRTRRTLPSMLAAYLLPGRYLAAQLRRPSGRFGRWVMTRGLNESNAELIQASLEALRLGPHERLLDLGFGGGAGLRRAAELSDGALWGVDFSPDVVRQAQRALGELVEAGRLNLLVGDAADLPLRDGLVDAICSTNTLYFFPDLPAALEELRRVTSAGGRIAFGYSGRAKMQSFDAITRHGFRTFEPDEVESLLRTAGWANVRSVALEGRVTQGDYVTLAHNPANPAATDV